MIAQLQNRSVLFAVLLVALFAACQAKVEVVPTVDATPSRGPSIVSCELCKLGLTLLAQWVKENRSEQYMFAKATDLCVKLKVEDPDVCFGVVTNTFGPYVLPILLELVIEPEPICQKVGFCAKKKETFTKPEMSPELAAIINAIPSTFSPMPKMKTIPTTGTGYILHFADIHIDPFYTVNSEAACTKPLCCRNWDSQKGQPIKTPALKWGSALCDIPVIMFEDQLKYISSMPTKPDFIVWTGDNPPHDVWIESQEQQLNASRIVASLIAKYFPTTPVFPALGNHESYPVDMYIPESFGWLTNGLAAMWTPFLPTDALNQFRNTGFYTTFIRPGVRLVALNTQLYDMVNFYNLKPNYKWPNQTEFLRSVLTQALLAGDQVYIIGHIPPGDGFALSVEAKAFTDILIQYDSAIAGVFMGHTHWDELEIVYDKTGKPTRVIYLAPSSTTYTGLNPAFRLYQYDRGSGAVTNVINYRTNLTQANIDDKPTWTMGYDAKSLYNMKDMSAPVWEALIQQMWTNQELFQLFYDNFSSGGETGLCSGNCKLNIMCRQLSSNRDLYNACMKSRGADAQTIATFQQSGKC